MLDARRKEYAMGATGGLSASVALASTAVPTPALADKPPVAPHIKRSAAVLRSPEPRNVELVIRKSNRPIHRTNVMIRPVTPADAASIAGIYNYYILNTVITFEEEPVPVDVMTARIHDVQADALPWLVAEGQGEVLGYAYATKWKVRSAYRYSVEATVYLAHECTNRGWGTQLYAALFAELKRGGFHAVIGGITLPNPASVALHEKLGMNKVAHFQQVGFKFDRWLDVGYWERLL